MMIMKRILSYLTIPALLLAAASCAPKEEIEFSHEAQAFETRSQMILIEGIMPQASAQDDEIYIIGEFNGGESAIGQADYLMTHSETITSKWGIYLDPGKFQGGKTLADGFTFYSIQQGLERSPKNEDVLHTLTIGPGEWANVYVDKWAKYFASQDDTPGETLPEHEGVRVYVIDQTGWAGIALYQWGDVNDFGGGWPGAQVAGTLTFAGQEFKYFEYGDDIIGLSQHLIFNNNGDGIQLSDYDLAFEEGIPDYFFTVTAEAVTRMDTPTGGGSDPRSAMTQDSPWSVIGSIASTGNGWDSDEPMVTDGTWHAALGLELTSSDEFKFRRDSDWEVNFGGNFAALGEAFALTQDGPNILVAEDGTYDLFLNPDAALAVIVAAGASVTLPSGEGGEEPTPPEEIPADAVTVYVQDLTLWDELNLYMWGDKELCGGWPGMQPAADAVKIGSVSYKVFTVEDAEGRGENLIFNNNAGSQSPDFSTVLSGELFLSVDENGTVTELDPRNPDIRILVNNKTDWAEIAVYAWGDVEAFGGWPGATPVGTETVGDVTYTVFGLPAEMEGKSINLIFNNNGDGQQLPDYAVTVPADELFLNINAEYSVGPVDGNPRGADKNRVAIFVDDRTSWDDFGLYQWGDVNNLGGDWPGAAFGGLVSFGTATYKAYFFDDALGLSQHLIFNNGGQGIQHPDFDLQFERNEYFFAVDDEGVTLLDNPESVAIFVDNQTGWEDMALYMWGDVNNLGGDWPGSQVAGTVQVGETAASVYVVDDAFGKSENLIFNNNGAGEQLPDYALTFGRNAYYLKVTGSGVTVF